MYADTTNLSGKGLVNFLKLNTNLSIVPGDDYVTILPGSLSVDFKLHFQMAGIDSIDITTNNYALSDAIDFPVLELPEMDMTETGITNMEIYRNVLLGQGQPVDQNWLKITDLKSTFPFDVNFLLNFKNFSPPPGKDSIKIELSSSSQTFE